jgi:hypothetical protein
MPIYVPARDACLFSRHTFLIDINRFQVLWRGNGMLKGWLYDWRGMATTGGQNSETRSVERLLVVYLCVCSLSLIDA